MTTVYFKASTFRAIVLILTLQIIYRVERVESATCKTQPCLYFSHSKSLQSVEISSSKVYSVLPSLKNVVAVDVHVKQNLVFWSETRPNAIKMLNITDGKVANVLSPDNLGEVEGLAVEWESGLLYWTDYTNRRIEVAQLDGQNRKILIIKGVRNPRGISVDPRTGYMFWTSWGTRTRIQRASLSGDNQVTLVDLFSSWQFLPNGITLDFTENRLYWADALYTQIESIDFNGNNRRRFALLPSNLHPYDIVLHGGVFYLSDWGSSYIERINKMNMARLQSYIGLGDGNVFGLAMFSQSSQPPGNTSCHSKNLCSHLCLLSPNGHQCACPTGTMLNADARTCDNNGISRFLLFVDENQEAIYQFPLETKYPSTQELPLALDDVQNPIAVDYDPVESRLYWSDDHRGAIFRAQLNGSWQEQIVHDLRKPQSIAVDSIGRNLYWTDSQRNRIEVSKLNGSFRKALVYSDLDEPAGILLDVENGYMYWCERGNGFFPRIERANMDGTNRIVIQRLHSGVSPKRLALDRDRNWLYFIDELSKAIKFVTLGTSVTTTVVMRSGTPTGLAVHGSYIYWTERLGQGGSVYKADRGSGGNIERIADGFQGPEDICVYGGNNTIQSVNSGCKSNNGGCSHLCLLTPVGHRCACPNEMTLKDDMKTCHFSEFLLYADPGRKRIFKIDLDDLITPEVALNLRNTQSPTALDFDPQESLIYWSDVQLDQIFRSHPSGNAFQVVVASGLQSPRGIAVDFVARNLYWTDYFSNKIEVSKLNGSYRKVLISQNLQSAVDIVLDMENGLMYWSCWGLQPKIERASMNGSNRTTIINLWTTVWGHPSRPTGLALDPTNSRLYWVDSSARHIQYTDLKRVDGTAVTVNIASGYLWQPYGLTLKENRLIWSDATSRRIYSADKNSGGDVKRIVSNVMVARDVHAYHNYTALPDDHPCALVNGWCTHLCLLVPGGYRCACPNSVASGIPCRTSPVPPSSSTIGFRSNTPETSTLSSGLSSPSALPEMSSSSRTPSHPLLLSSLSSLSSQSSLFPSSSFRILHLSNPVSSPMLVSSSALSISTTKASTLSPTESTTTYPFSPSSISSGSISLPLSTSIPLFPSVPSFPKLSMEAPHSVAESSSTPTSSAVPTSAPKDACIPNPCRNGGKCVVGAQGQLSCRCPVAYTSSFCELLIGNNSVTITFRMVSDQWEEDTFKESIAKAFTDVDREKQWSFQERNVIHSKRRSAVSFIFKPSDVLVLSHVETHPSHLDVVAAVLVPTKDQSATRKTISAAILCKMVKESATDISRYMGDHDVAFINGESDPSCDASKGTIKAVNQSEEPGKSLTSSKIAGIVVGILMLFIALSAAFCYWRARQREVPWNQMGRRDMIPSFNNPGFTSNVQESGMSDVEPFPFPVPDYEEVPPAFPRNPLQTEVGSMPSTAEVPVYAAIGPSTSFAETKEIPTRNNKDSINYLLPNVEAVDKMHNRNAQRATALPSELCNDIAERGNFYVRQANETLMVSPTYEHVNPFGTSRRLAKCNASQEGSRSSAMEVERADSEYSSLGGSESTRQLDNTGAKPQYATPFIKHLNNDSSGASSETKRQYASLRNSKVSAANGLSESHGYAQLDPTTRVCPGKTKHPFASSSVLGSHSQVPPSSTPEEREADSTRLDARASEGCRRQLQQQRHNENYDHVQNANCTPGVAPVLVLERERNGDTEIDETCI